jgi:AraC-like DNA-binding protein
MDFPFIAWSSQDATFPPHWHDFFEMMYIIKGGLYVSINDTVYEAEGGDIIMVNSGFLHSYFDTKPRTEIFGLQFSINFFDECFINWRDIIFQNPVIGKNKMADSLHVHVCRLLQDISREYHEKTVGYQFAIKSKLYELMLAILRGMPKVDHKIPSAKSRYICDFILKNFDNPGLRLEEAAKTLKMNKFYFAHLFKKRMGYSFHSYLTTTRVNFAKRYLLETDVAITDVAFRSGFNSLQTFNRVFKVMTGFTPGDYRRENNIAEPT